MHVNASGRDLYGAHAVAGEYDETLAAFKLRAVVELYAEGVREEFVASRQTARHAHDEPFAVEVEVRATAFREREASAVCFVGLEAKVAARRDLRKLRRGSARREDSQEVHDGNAKAPARVPVAH